MYEAYLGLKQIKTEISALEDRKTYLEERIKLCFGDAEAVSYGGQTIATWKAPKPSQKFDDKTFKVDHPDLYSEYVKEVQGSRRFLIK